MKPIRYVPAKVQLKAYIRKRAFVESTSNNWQSATDDLLVLEQAVKEAQLTARQLFIIKKYCFDEWLQHEIAYELHVSQPSVSRTYNRAVSKIQAVFNKWEKMERSL
ncbi:hypothetical protein MFLO_15563 [Listeria floridensis FSL S10-1187]|uniref:RNA polymerase sigma-70 region 4 domain-containing protein n=1 Tax=Listeria floridensis FSL S10-1187 TaxID=1265817 RepID=A0ABN0RBC7_9LIST|nr:sigma factor-like helix-turn-helix DNA-binding protein [Listeria floridensis]EUJ25244.1 hypothetical protein MFLO_15563 [Listeria floridensis FSL S10-1187]